VIANKNSIEQGYRVLFPTLEFAAFFCIVLPVCWALNSRPRQWAGAMLAASLVFYGWWDVRFVALILAATLLNQLAAVSIHRARAPIRRHILIAAITADLTILGLFKYYGFFILSTEAAFAALGMPLDLPLLDIILPVGISFFTFQALSYVIDVYRRQLAPAPLLHFAVYLAFFPQLVAGPIVRASELLPQLTISRDPERIDTARAWRLIVGGLFKKAVIADLLATTLVDPVFAEPAAHTGPQLALAIYGYAVQIYCDFSAYSDIAIGLALLMGLSFPDNFDAPYTATSLRDFWRRWHMTLSRWLRDYLYIPLGGSRDGPWRTYRNLMLTMVLGGLWHGASWRFVLWGTLHGGYLAVERLLKARYPQHRWPVWARRLLVFHYVCFCWIFFRAQSMADVGTILTGLVSGWSEPISVHPGVIAALLLGLGSQWVPKRVLTRLEERFSVLPAAGQGVALAVALVGIEVLGPPGVAAFIYFQF
jgi:alginate O-acetyltransferase complex protein AlgI